MELIKNTEQATGFFINLFKKPDSNKFTSTVHLGVFNPRPFILKAQDKEVYILGTPIIDNVINRPNVAKIFLNTDNLINKINEINGTFLIVVLDNILKKVTIITDRYASISFFYRSANNSICCSTCFSDIWKLLKQENILSINPYAFYELICFQKLFGTKTFDKKTFLLEPAMVLTISFEAELKLSQTKYWLPQYTKSKRSEKENAFLLSELLKASFIKYTSDQNRYALLLSGGLDSRAVLAASNHPLDCITIGESQNNEVEVARILAEAKDCSHYFIQRPSDYYSLIIENAVTVGSCMNTFDHAHFFVLMKNLGKQPPIMFHGHGMDYFFQGMYLPHRLFTIFGKKTFIPKLLSIKDNILDIFCNSIKYRLKDVDANMLIKNELKGDVKDYIHNSLEGLMQEVAKLTIDEYDIWEYMHTFNLSRHYTHLNLQSLRTVTEERTIAFENDIFDFYFQLPVNHRLGARVFKKAIQILAPELMRIRNANTNMKASWSPLKSTRAMTYNYIFKKIFHKELLLSKPSAKDRSWPDRNAILREHSRFKKIAETIVKSGRLESLGLFDIDMVNNLIQDHFNEKKDVGALILTLITMDNFL